MLFNLIKNALYYMALVPGKPSVTITVERQPGEGARHRSGYPAEACWPRLFEPFAIGGQVRWDRPGPGLLPAASCAAFGGEIGCESVEGEYTEFTLRFPPMQTSRKAKAHRSRGACNRARAAFAGKRLLIVDDDSAQRMTTRHKLAGPLGAADRRSRSNGQRALEACSPEQRYDLVLLDLNMPVARRLCGCAEKIRQGQVPANRNVRIVAHTSEPAHLASVKTQKAGMDGFVGKPCAQLPLRGGVAAGARRIPAAAVQPDAALLAGRRSPGRRRQPLQPQGGGRLPAGTPEPTVVEAAPRTGPCWRSCPTCRRLGRRS